MTSQGKPAGVRGNPPSGAPRDQHGHEARRASSGRRFHFRALPRTFQGRLSLAFVFVFVVAVGIVAGLTVFVLDSYLYGEAHSNLEARARAVAVRAAREGALTDPEGRGLEATLAVHGIAPLPPRPKIIQVMRRPGGNQKVA